MPTVNGLEVGTTTRRIEGDWVVYTDLNRFGLALQSFGYHQTRDLAFSGRACEGYTVTAMKEGDNAEPSAHYSTIADIVDYA